MHKVAFSGRRTHHIGRRLTILALLAIVVVAASGSAYGLRQFGGASEPGYAHQLRANILAVMQRERIPGAIVAIRTPKWGRWVTTLCTANIYTGTRMSSTDHMRVGSITKTLTATIILQLAQRHRISLDAPVSTYWSGVPNGHRITIRHMLNMTSGLYNYSEDPAFNRRLDTNPSYIWSPLQLLHIAFSHHVYFQPGKGWHYSNTNYILLGLIAEKLTKHSLGYDFERSIFRPLSMTETSLADKSPNMPKPHAHGYLFIGNLASLAAPTLTGKAAAWADWSAGNPTDETYASPSWAWAAGGAISTTRDLLKWGPALATGKGVLNAAMQHQRISNLVPTSPAPGAPLYGLGIAKFAGFLGHDGQLPGYNSFVGYDPSLRATIVVLVCARRHYFQADRQRGLSHAPVSAADSDCRDRDSFPITSL
jgi:D-alanyl-D-alanine carboxypeptidase